MKKFLPIGIQDFVKIREGGYHYVDKTVQIHRLISSGGGAFFLSRPRRFGKSLLCSTLGAIFEGKQEHFAGLAIDSLNWEWKKHPVIRIDMNAGDYTEGTETLKLRLQNILKNAAINLDLNLRGELVSDQFENLIMDASRKYENKTVVIVDEYDKPLTSTIETKELHDDMRRTLKGFYGVLKSCDEYLKFVFLTGITKFSHVSIFSDLNHLYDLTFDPLYADICGWTQEEVEENFTDEIEGVLKLKGKKREEYLDELKRFYNGYRFSEKEITVYNPFGLLNHFKRNGKFSPYWYKTGTPTFLINLIVNQHVNVVELTNIKVYDEDFGKYDIEEMKLEPLLYQTGYLTIVDYDEESDQFTLGYPNEEVRTSFSKSLFEKYFKPSAEISDNVRKKLPQFLIKGDIENAILVLKSFFSSTPNDVIEKKEKNYELAVHLIFSIFGLDCRSEVRTSSGRIDTLVITRYYVYCFEFKLNKTAEEAIAQIDEKDYLLPWKYSGKTLFKIGINFDHETRNISDYIIEKLDS